MLVLLLVFTLILLVGFVFARRQDRVNRAMAEMQGPGQEPRTEYVGPHLPGPFRKDPMLKRHLLPLLVLPLLATSCLAYDPLPVPSPSNSGVLVMDPALLKSCGTVTWTLTYLRAERDVTGEARYILEHRSDDPVQVPAFILSGDQDGPDRGGFLASPVDEAGALIDRVEFSDAVTHDVTCARTGDRASLTQHRGREADGPAPGYNAVEVTERGGHLSLN